MSIVQVAFLPGYLALRAARLAVGPLSRTLVLSFALSLVINHFLVVALVLAGWYRPGVIYAVFAVEAALAFWSARAWSARSVGETATRLAIWARRSAPRGAAPALGPTARLRGGRVADRRLRGKRPGPRRRHLPAMGRGDFLEPLGDGVGRQRPAAPYCRVSATPPHQPLAHLRLHPRQSDLVLRQGADVAVLPVSPAGDVGPRTGDRANGIFLGRADRLRPVGGRPSLPLPQQRLRRRPRGLHGLRRRLCPAPGSQRGQGNACRSTEGVSPIFVERKLGQSPRRGAADEIRPPRGRPLRRRRFDEAGRAVHRRGLSDPGVVARGSGLLQIVH